MFVKGIRGSLAEAKSWRERIAAAKEVGQLNPVERLYLTRKAGDWDCCAVGESREKLKEAGHLFMRTMFHHTVPANDEVAGLGIAFAHAVGAEDWLAAEDLLSRIESFTAQKETVPA